MTYGLKSTALPTELSFHKVIESRLGSTRLGARRKAADVCSRCLADWLFAYLEYQTTDQLSLYPK